MELDHHDRPATLGCLSRLLDQCLELDTVSLQTWLEALPQHERAEAPRLRQLVMKHRHGGQADFLPTRPALAPAAQLAVAGASLGPYRLVRQIGRGGMGTVWEAEHRQHGTKVAIKLHRRPDDPRTAAQVRRESELTALMKHPRVAHLLEAGADTALGPYLVLALIDAAQPLTASLSTTRKPLRARLRRFVQMADLVAHVHARGVVHRDLKPGNFLAAADGSVHLIDFGIAVRTPTNDGARVPVAERSLTPAYAAPEQLRGEAATPASDVYALALMLLDVLAGRRPRRLDAIVAKALSPVATQRHADAGELADAIRRASAAALAHAPGASSHGRRSIRRAAAA